MAEPFSIQTLTFGYDEFEDRLLLSCRTADGEDAATLMITRRMLRGLLRGATDFLARSSPTAGRAPVDYRDDVLAMEHQGAVAKSAQAQGASADRTPVPVQEHRILVVKLDLEPRAGGGYQLVLSDREGPRAGMALTRDEFHHILKTLADLARTGGWDLDREAGWIAPAAVAPSGQGRVLS
ncbi:MAG TPA: hypothetical protein VEB20_16100 [Azospirillaceae bacterium]|nr:hypothetical protein [Azospirillaceae bacterium]